MGSVPVERELYLRDTGLLHHLLGIRSHGELESHPVRGASWETFVIEDVLRREALGDIGAGRGWIVDQGEGIERLDSAIARAGFAEVIRGVPE